jgi:low affinity Fe/Cu permease
MTETDPQPKKGNAVNEWFRRFAHATAERMGRPWAFLISLVIVAGWALIGPLFHYSDTWQLVINTATTIVTFLMVFLIQNTQNRDAKAIHLKLDELIHSIKGARNRLINLEELSEDELTKLQKEFEQLHARYNAKAKENGPEKVEEAA